MSDRKKKRYEKDFQKAFAGGDAPRYCPVRIDENPINPAGNVCGLMWRQAKPPEPIETEGGGPVTRWRCCASSPPHIFGKKPQ